MTDEQVQRFGSCYLFGGVAPEAVREVAGLAEFGAMLAGEVLARAGERSADLFVILDGRVNVLTKHGDKLGEAGAGAVIGEVSLVDDQPRSADCVCAGMVQFARLPSKELRRYMAANKDAGFTMLANLARVLSMRLRQTDQAMGVLFDRGRDPWEHPM
jgi:CRP-like cAMP-binding protein